MPDPKEKPSQQLLQEIADFRDGRQSALMATVDMEGVPEASVVPYVLDDTGDIYIYVSALSRHTSNLSESGKASLVFVEDEQDAGNMFARKRLSYSCVCDREKKDSQQWKWILDKFEARFGKFVQTLRDLPDFTLFHLKPVSGSYISGFGKTFRLGGDKLQQVNQVSPENISSNSRSQL